MSESSVNSTIDAVINCNSDDFIELVKVSGLDPRRDFRYSDLRNVNLVHQVLQGFDFTGADLRYADLRYADFRSSVTIGVRLDGARYEGALGLNGVVQESDLAQFGGDVQAINAFISYLNDELNALKALPEAAMLAGAATLAEKVQAYRVRRPVVSGSVLSARERTVFNLVAQGKSNREISKILTISERTVNYHIDNARKKVKARNRMHALVELIVSGEIDPVY